MSKSLSFHEPGMLPEDPRFPIIFTYFHLMIEMVSLSSSSPAPAMIGVDNKNEKLAALSRVSPKNKPPVMVIPERETPGITASA